MIKVVVIGAGGRMGRLLVARIMEAEDLQLFGAVEAPGNPLLGQDAGIIAGQGSAGVMITADLKAACTGADSVINFSTGDVPGDTEIATTAGCSCVIGTTALSEDSKAKLRKLADDGARIVFAPNMSVGVNLLFHLCGKVASLLGDDYDIEIVEMHHNLKKDAPSGTAVRLGEIAAAARGLSYENDTRHGREGITGARTTKEIGMHALRGGDVVGDHTVMFATCGERLELTHKASSRDTFVKGALRAVRFLDSAKPGLYDMQDVLGLK
ncbi:MAG: 4-hydroxy-tetrahydrodipicolinate reductase [Victivallaceae bacterium]|nr:4-hydroxy-tetrahydrodipicolinate reductase [Victivallaceae bacterium]